MTTAITGAAIGATIWGFGTLAIEAGALAKGDDTLLDTADVLMHGILFATLGAAIGWLVS